MSKEPDLKSSKPNTKLTSTDPSSDQLIEINNSVEVSIPNEQKYPIEGIMAQINDAQLISSNSISLKIDDDIYSYKRTQTLSDVEYFQCINRKKGERTNKKCLAKIHYFPKTNSIYVLNLHNPNCKLSTI